MKRIVLLLLSLAAGAGACAAPAGAATSVPAAGASSAEAVRQPDGKVVAIADESDCPAPRKGCPFRFAVSRKEPNGAPDPSFGVDGLAATDFGGVAASPSSVAIDAQGRIVVAGTYSSYGDARGDFVLVRFLADGTLDPSFGAGGVARTDSAESRESASGLAIAPDGKLIVYGSTFEAGGAGIVLCRYEEDGSPDATFGGGDGVAPIPVAPFSEPSGGAVAVQGDGRILIGTAVTAPSSAFTHSLVVLRIESDGALDSTFGKGGVASGSPVTGSWGGVQARLVFVDAIGNVIVAGTQRTGEHCCFDGVLARFKADGGLDSGFGKGGDGVAELPRSSLAAASALPGGDLLVGSQARSGILLTQLGSDGRVRPTFNARRRSVRVAGLGTQLEAVFPEADGGALALASVSGHCPAPGRPRGHACDARALVRFDARGRLDRDFGGVGFLTHPRIYYCRALPTVACGVNLGASGLRELTSDARPRTAYLRGRQLSLRLRCGRRIVTNCRIATAIQLGTSRKFDTRDISAVKAGRSKLVRLTAPPGLTRRLDRAGGELEVPLRQHVRANGIEAGFDEFALRLLRR